ncbi:MAG: transcription/translation regulatory transformer protein RfaH [Halioglobus sp.]
MKQWYAVHAKPRQEVTAEDNLKRQGFETYLPRIKVRKLKRGQWEKVVEPLFPRYLFVLLDPGVDNTAPIRSTRGVVGLVRIGFELHPVPDAVVAYLMQAEDSEQQVRLADEWPYQPGDKVEILDGSLAGLTGVFQMQSAEGRALLLIELLGRNNEVSVGLHEITATA